MKTWKIRPLTRNREIVTLALVFCLCFSALGFKACSQSQNVSWAKDVVSSLKAARPFVVSLKPGLIVSYDKGIALADSALGAIQAGNAANAVQLLSELLPIFNQAAALFTNNPTALAALALADIGLHFLLNHLPQAAIAARRQKAAQTNAIDPITEFKNQQVWGCAYLPEKCKN